MAQVTWNFEGSRVLVTGGATGIGLGISTAFTNAGAQVVVLDRNKAALDEAVGKLNAVSPGKVSGLECNLADPADIVRAAAEVTERIGGVDILVNNAGVGFARPLVDMTDEELALNIDVNLRASILLTRELVRGMLARGTGVIINLASQAAKTGFPNIAHYSASKAGILGFTSALAAELAPTIRVNSVSPGTVLTGMMENNIRLTREEKGLSYEEAYAFWTADIPMGRMQETSDIANGVLFLASDAAKEITGEQLNVSGGQTTT